MPKETNEPTDLSNGYHSGAPRLNGAEPSAPPPPRTSEMQLLAFRDLARRIHTDLSVQRFEAALRTLLLPIKKPPHEPTVQPPTHNPES